MPLSVKDLRLAAEFFIKNSLSSPVVMSRESAKDLGTVISNSADELERCRAIIRAFVGVLPAHKSKSHQLVLLEATRYLGQIAVDDGLQSEKPTLRQSTRDYNEIARIAKELG